MQAALKEGLRSTLATLLEATASSMEVALWARNVSSASLITSSGNAGTGLQIVASYDISVIISPPVRRLLCYSSRSTARWLRCMRPVAAFWERSVPQPKEVQG